MYFHCSVIIRIVSKGTMRSAKYPATSSVVPGFHVKISTKDTILFDSVGTPSKHNDFRTIKLARIAAINWDTCQT